MFRPHTAILSCYRILSSRSCCSVMPMLIAYFCLSICQQSTWRPQRQHNYSNKRTADNKHNIRRSTCLAHGWQRHIGEHWHNRARTSGGEYSITPEDGHVRPKHVLIEFKKWMCYIDGQKNKYSVLNECNRMLKYNIFNSSPLPH
jgi:hypothetical protein